MANSNANSRDTTRSNSPMVKGPQASTQQSNTPTSKQNDQNTNIKSNNSAMDEEKQIYFK